MAEGAPYKEDQDLVTWLIGLIFVAVILSSLLSAINARLGVDISHPRQAWETLRVQWFGDDEFSDDTPLGTIVETIASTFTWGTPGIDGELLEIIKTETRGIITGGPEYVNGVRWWKVSFDEEGVEGWVSEDDLMIVTQGYRFAGVFGFVSIVLSATLLIGIVYAMIRLSQVRKVEMEMLSTIPPEFGSEENRSPRWVRVYELVNSNNPSDWRQAIIEADVMLDELVTKQGYRGDSLGEKMKTIEESDFITINDAWEAHKARNRIAHSGSDFVLTQREARRFIGLFEKVFEEFQII
jgi:hypothetical protein